ncbi:unnamed protein product, partial [Didymodactylos carnosus]
DSKSSWMDVIDKIMDSKDIVLNWYKDSNLKSLLLNRQLLLKKYGIWGCLSAAIVTCKLAKYHTHTNCDQHIQTCILSSYFLRSIFFYTLPHSEYDYDYSTLFIDNQTQLWPGIQLTSDEYVQ